MDMLAPQDPLDVRTWNGTPISRRTTDGYVNATAVCRGQWQAVEGLPRVPTACQLYLEARCTESVAGISVSTLLLNLRLKGGAGHRRHLGPSPGRG
jgi:hypothetical protein